MSASKSKLKKKILLVDDHPLLRQGIGQLINQQPDLTVCAEAEDCAGALNAAETSRPDLAIIDLSLKDERGLELIKDFSVRFPQVLTLVLSMHDESLYAERALLAGARGYIMKQEASEKVLEAIRQVLDGGVFVSHRITASILEKVSGRSRTPGRSPLQVLSDRELEVLHLIGKGFGAQQIAKQLHISAKTVEAHRANIKLKLKLESGSDLLQYAIRWTQHSGEV